MPPLAGADWSMPGHIPTHPAGTGESARCSALRRGVQLEGNLSTLAMNTPPDPLSLDHVASSTFPPIPSSVPVARRFAIAHVHAWGAMPATGRVALLVSELATNAVLHARSDFTVTLSTARGRIRVAVADEEPSGPGPSPAAAEALHCRGLAIVERVTSRWGWDDVPGDGKVVWGELSEAE